MTNTNLDVISRALRLLGVLSAGQVASDDDGADGLVALQDVVDTLPLLRTGEWTEVLLTSAAPYTARDGERIHTQGHLATIDLPTTFTDPRTSQLTAQQDLSRVQIIGGEQAGLYIYSASLGAWSKVDGLEISGDCPFGPEDFKGLAALVAAAVADEQGQPLPPLVGGAAAQALSSFHARFYREVVVQADPAFLIMSDTNRGPDYEGFY